jgi:hypothetical protein
MFGFALKGSGNWLMIPSAWNRAQFRFAIEGER